MKRSILKGIFQILVIVAVPLFFMLPVTITDKLAYGEDKLMKEVETYSTTINGQVYRIPTIVPKSFASWPISIQRSSNPEYSVVQWTTPTEQLKIRFTTLMHLPTSEIRIGAYGLQGLAASHWWIWQDEKVYEVSADTAREYIEYLESLRSV